MNPASFVMNDISILEKFGKVRKLRYIGKRRLPALSNALARSDFVYCWFVLGYATSSVLLSTTMRKKSILVAGGWDVIYLPEMGYGAMNGKRRIEKTAYALREADRVLAVSESTRNEVLKWVDRDVDVIYNGVDTNRYCPKDKKKNLVVTVGAIGNSVSFKIKGLETFLGVATKMPDTEFVLVGAKTPEWTKKLRELAPKNVTVTGKVTDERLLTYFQEAKVYAQLSYHESFGLSLAEAMACGCVPVVTNRFALPEVVGETGFYVEYGAVDETVEATRKALEATDGDKCRKRIVDNFDIEIRERELLRIVKEVLSG